MATGAEGKPEKTARRAKPPLRAQVLGAFRGDVEPVQVSLFYRLALAVVALLMVLLPLTYVALVGLTAYAVYYHAVNHAGLVAGGIYGILVYVAPMVVGGVLVAFMIKPLFARQEKQSPPLSLDQHDEPLLFEFIDRVCDTVGAPQPRRVDVDLQVNASAGFRRGLLSFLGNDLVLTIGLPLAAGLSMRQLAGVLAHEFGHFAQRGGMRFTYIIRAVSVWFARVVYERDAWDAKLVHWSRGVDIRVGIIFYLARVFIWITRKILWLLMMIGHVVSGIMLRQMEHDADRYEMRLAGSESFQTTMSRMRVLGIAAEGAFADLTESWRERRLNDDFPALIVLNVDDIPKDFLTKMHEAVATAKTGAFDTHPADRDRVRAAQDEGAPGIFRLEYSAGKLFADFKAVCRDATFRFYQEALGEQVTQDNLVPTEQLVERQRAVQEVYKAGARYFQGVMPPLYPLGLESCELQPPGDGAAAIQALRDARRVVEQSMEKAREAGRRYEEADGRHLTLVQALALDEAGFVIPHTQIQLSSKQPEVARSEARSARKKMDAANYGIAAFVASGRDRLRAALRLLHVPEVGGRFKNAAALHDQARRLIDQLRRLTRQRESIVKLRENGNVVELLTGAIAGNEKNPKLFAKLDDLLDGTHTILTALNQEFAAVAYPFKHAEGRVTVAKYAIGDVPEKEAPMDVFRVNDDAVQQLVSLYYRIVGRLASIAERIETLIGLDPLPMPPTDEGEQEKS